MNTHSKNNKDHNLKSRTDLQILDLTQIICEYQLNKFHAHLGVDKKTKPIKSNQPVWFYKKINDFGS